MRKRKPAGTRKIERRLFILCEGARDKSEHAYFTSFIRDCRLPAGKVDVRVVDTKKNTGRELVKEAKNIREFPDDILWVVYDKDGYTLHPETVDLARRADINIAFSSISFEFWILVHFQYTTRPFADSEEVITFIQKHIPYTKSDINVYDLTKNNISMAMERARQIQEYQRNVNPPETPIYEYNPYTDVDRLIKAIWDLCEK